MRHGTLSYRTDLFLQASATSRPQIPCKAPFALQIGRSQSSQAEQLHALVVLLLKEEPAKQPYLAHSY